MTWTLLVPDNLTDISTELGSEGKSIFLLFVYGDGVDSHEQGQPYQALAGPNKSHQRLLGVCSPRASADRRFGLMHPHSRRQIRPFGMGCVWPFPSPTTVVTRRWRITTPTWNSSAESLTGQEVCRLSKVFARLCAMLVVCGSRFSLRG